MQETEWKPKDLTLPRVEPLFVTEVPCPCAVVYQSLIEELLSQVVPVGIFKDLIDEKAPPKECAGVFEEMLPIISLRASGSQFPYNLSFMLVCKHRPNAFKFFFDMVSSWVIPGKRPEVVVFYAADFCFPDLSEQVYTLAEVTVRVESAEVHARIEKNWSQLESEIRLGLISPMHAKRIMEIKGLAAVEKVSYIQEIITELMERRPEQFGADLLAQMQHFLVVCKDRFKEIRSYRHIARIICWKYLLHKELQENLEKQPQRRHLFVRLIKGRLRLDGDHPSVLGVLVGLNFLNEQEIFEERHLVKAVHNYLPSAHVVMGSFFTHKSHYDSICTLYLEMKKEDGGEFSTREIEQLRKRLSIDLQGRIESVQHPVFMPHNEEECLRHILTLSKQLKFLRDLPQVMISFDKQTPTDISFTVILLRVLKPGMWPLSVLFQEKPSRLKAEFDPPRVAGLLRKKYKKEANVFRVQLDKSPFLRSDHSLDFYRARQVVASELANMLGEFRDYNGGMISLEYALFTSLRARLIEEGVNHDFLLESFFYGLHPAVMRSVFEPQVLQRSFKMLREVLEEPIPGRGLYLFRTYEDAHYLYIMIAAGDPTFKEAIETKMLTLDAVSMQRASVFVSVYDRHCLGYIHRIDGSGSDELFVESIETTLFQWHKEKTESLVAFC